MDDEMLDLMTKMYAQMEKGFSQVYAEMKKGFEQVDKRFEQVDKRFEQMDKRFEQVDKRFEQMDKRMDGFESSLARIEHDHGEKLAALFDGQKVHSEKLDLLDKKVDKLQEDFGVLALKIVQHDNRITALELASGIK